jgi:PH domain
VIRILPLLAFGAHGRGGAWVPLSSKPFLGVLQGRDVTPLLGSFEDILSSSPSSHSVLVISEDTLTEKASKFILPKLHISTIHRSLSTASHRPASSNEAPQKSLLNLNPNATTGINANVPKSFNGVSGFFKQGVNTMFDRIGEPDHTGWMRKRGDRNDSWKSRYFILKGPHLYFLKSDNKLVSCSSRVLVK